MKNIDAEAPLVVVQVGEVHLFLAGEPVDLVCRQDAPDNFPNQFLARQFHCDRNEGAGNTQRRIVIRFEMDV